MIVKILFILALLGIIVSLFTGLVALLRNRNDNAEVAKSLSWRIGLSLGLFLLLLVLHLLGVVHLHGLHPAR